LGAKSNWEEIPGQTKTKQEGFYILYIHLRIPQEELEGVSGERFVWVRTSETL